jgi:hypothetical protein
MKMKILLEFYIFVDFVYIYKFWVSLKVLRFKNEYKMGF